jgi:hypothetical protein
MGAARLAAITAARHPEYKKYVVDVAAFNARIRERDEKLKEQETKFLAEIETSRRNLLFTLRELKFSRDETARVKSSNADLQQKLQDQDAMIAGLRSVNADLEKKVKGFGNIAAFLGKIASGEVT